jgi:Fic family protein
MYIRRLLIAFLLTERKLLARPVLYLSHYFKRRRADYYERLQAIRDSGDWEGWISFFLAGVAEVSRQATETAAAILRMREEYRGKVADRLDRSAGSAYRVMDKLFNRLVITVKSVQKWLDITPAEANNIVSRLQNIGLLPEMTGFRRNRRFRFDPYLRLFEEPEEGRQ